MLKHSKFRFSAILTSVLMVAVLAGYQHTTVALERNLSKSERTDSFSAMKVRIDDYFHAFASGRRTEYQAWLEANRTEASLSSVPMAQRLDQYENDFANWGPLKAIQFKKASDTTIEVSTEGTGSEHPVFVFQFQNVYPHNVISLNLRMGGPVSINMTITDDWASLQDLADEVQSSTGVPAIAIGVYAKGKSNLAVSGNRRFDRPSPIQLTDAFHWGSVGKSATGTVIGALIDQGKLSWNTTMGEVFDKVPMQDAYRDVTIWQLMAHQAGVPTYTLFDETFDARIQSLPGVTDAEKRAAFVREVLLEPVAFQPGTQAEYSNAGPTIAGRMAEIVSGQTWEELVAENVFRAANMKNAGFQMPVKNETMAGALGHGEQTPGEYEMLPPGEGMLDPDVIAPAGGIHSSIEDLLNFGVMHLKGLKGKDGTISSNTIKGLHTPQPGQPKSFGEDYTFGWGSRCPFPTTRAIRCQGHNGGGGFYYAQLLILPEEDIVVAYMSNTMGTSSAVSGQVFENIVNRYLEDLPD